MSKESADIPVIDISPSNPEAAKQILAAAENNGFLFIENNAAAGMPPAKVDEMFDLSKKFFQGPVENKKECPTQNNRGWVSMQQETLDPGNQKHRAFNLGEFTNNKPNQPLPKPFSNNVNTVADFSNSCHALCNRILELFAEALDIPSDWFSSRHDQSKGASGTIMRLLYYPSVPDSLAPEEDDIRAGAHSDYGTLTLLFQLPSQPGLEILTPSGTWSSVPVDPKNTLSTDPSAPLPILVNIGDLMSYWTNGLLKSTVHRVIFPKEARKGGEDRYSMAYFCHPLDDAELVAVPSKRIEQHKGEGGVEKGGKVLTAKDHLLERLAATYGTKA
ncbi:iron/ascorbate family oxidoreductase [Aureobasidium pullulans]|uniref:Iron/ascorbate family oxidoreductase n=1 Tax=Aureobasidium pullulans TaxID=5580 RepID=A0A4S8VD21_AURPU|nr:iron/ascorbate family oxidoreductase [Aureobasidium pullulans]